MTSPSASAQPTATAPADPAKLTFVAPRGIEINSLDADAIAYATFQSHNQKVVVNQHGIFTTHIHATTGKWEGQDWRLSRSTDGGKTFTTVFSANNNCSVPPMETDSKGNLYVAPVEYSRDETLLHFFKAPDFSKPAWTSAIPESASGKTALMLDEQRGRLYHISQNHTFQILSLDGKVEKHVVMFAAGAHAYIMYESLALAPDGTLFVAWTTQEKTKYLYWDIHWMLSKDGGQTWQKADGTKLTLPIVADDTGPADRLTLDDEFNVHTWLSSWLYANGKVHAVYWSELAAPRQRYLRLDPATGKIEVDQHRIFGDVPMTRVIDSGVLVRTPAAQLKPPGDNARLFYVSAIEDRHRLACLVSDDNGATWKPYAVSDRRFDSLVYSIGGYREVTSNGEIVGTFTVIEPGAETYYEPHSGKAYVFRIKAGP